MDLVVVLLCVAAIGVLAPGYWAWLRFSASSTPHRPGNVPHWPLVDVIVPLHDEISWVEAKIRNLMALRYPATRLRIWLVDGASTDGTAEIARAAIMGSDPRFELLQVPVGNKIEQLNAALGRSRGEYVMVTDADARLESTTLSLMVAAAERGSNVAAVGTTLLPCNARAIETLHWRILNRLRLAESRKGAASLLTGPCYLFRRSLMGTFPADVVADDVHVALTAATLGQSVLCLDVETHELRSPRSLLELFRHKVRKADAYLREMFRFLPDVGKMRSPARQIFLWRAAQLTLVPVFALLAGCALISRLGADWSLLMPLVSMVAVLACVAYPKRSSDLALSAGLGVFLTAVLLVALTRHPFSRQASCYPRVLSGAPKP